MTARPPARMSLSLRLALLVFLVETLLLGAFAVTVYLLCESRFFASFDAVLRANAESIGTLVEDEHGGGLEMEFADEIMRRFSRPTRPQLFAVLRADGRLLEKSRALAAVPGFVGQAAAAAVIHDFEHRGVPYRGIALALRRDSPEGPRPRIRARIFFAASTHDLRQQLRGLAEVLAWFTAAGLLISVGLAGLVAWRGLAPLRRLARETQAIGGESLDRRLAATPLPREVQVLARAINDLLGRLETAFERERRFSSDAAHELRTPVATLKSGLQAALLKTPAGHAEKRVLEALLTDVLRLEDLCDALLLVASSQARPAGARIDLEDWATEIEAVIRGFEGGPGAPAGRFHLSLPGALPDGLSLRTNRAATRRIVTNLLENAVQHGGPGVRVAVEISVAGAGAQLAVEDDGPGIAPKDRPPLFERFFRADRARSRETGGAGLGLAICQSLATAHGGRIRHEPVSPHGSRFVWTVAAS